MKHSLKVERRTACATMLGVGGSLLVGEKSHSAPRRSRGRKTAKLCFGNSDFYDDGKFSEDAAKQAYYNLMKAAGFPISDFVRENLWVADFSLGSFNEIGLGGVFWTNQKEWNYASVEIFLLPNQMIPEHWHVAIESDGVTPKMESWVVRYGKSYTYGEGEPAKKVQAKIHEREAQHITVTNETVLNVGQTTGITKPLEKHWMQAGPQGAVITEVSTFHTGDAVKFTNPDIKF
jgi:D-lyxose ketol-isomerase